MTGKKRRSSRIRMISRNRISSEGPSIVYDTQLPPHPYACNRAAKRSFTKSGVDHTQVPVTPLQKVGKGPDGNPIYFMGEERFIPPYLANRVKRNQDRKSK